MQSIGIRELRQHASRYLRAVEAGERITVTDRGRPVAQIVPIRAETAYDRLVAEGKLIPGDGSNILDHEPIKLPPGAKPPSEILAEMREHER
jgi:prevent-host-death family protein